MNRITVVTNMLRKMQDQARQAAETERRRIALNRELAWEADQNRHSPNRGPGKSRY